MLAGVLRTPIEDLVSAVDALAAECIEAHSTHALGDDLVAIRRQVDRLEAQFIRRLHGFDRGHGAHAENSPTTVSWLRATCGLTVAAASDRVRMARTLDDLPMTAASFEAGRAPYANVSLISRLAEAVGCDATREVEETLVPAAETLDAGRMFRLTEFTRHRLDADGALEQENRNHERRWFACDRTYGGVFVLRGELDTEAGALLQTALDAMGQKRGEEDRRSGSQRRADALVDMAAAMLQRGELPSVHGVRPHLVLTASLDALCGVRGAPPAELAGVGPIHAETARRLACDAGVRVAVETPNPGQDRSFSIGRESRRVPAPMRTAVALRDRGCRFPGCDRPASWTEAHHVAHWADGGDTAVSNLVSLCRFHHRLVHEGGQEFQLLPDGTMEVSSSRRSTGRAGTPPAGVRLPRLE